MAATGNDTITGGDGNDIAARRRRQRHHRRRPRQRHGLARAPATTRFVWNPGDGSDTVEGQDGHDTMLFNGANINEKFDLSANG